MKVATLVEDFQIRCPTCGAAQPASAECRRCKCDLGLYQSLLIEGHRLKLVTLHYLREGDYAAAANAAELHCAVSPNQDGQRLAAVAYLLTGRYDAALRVYTGGQRADG
jgi:hypothetical protein